jgi:hypothetical protein
VHPFLIDSVDLDIDCEAVEVTLRPSTPNYSEAAAISVGWRLMAECRPLEHVILQIVQPGRHMDEAEARPH